MINYFTPQLYDKTLDVVQQFVEGLVVIVISHDEGQLNFMFSL